MLRELLLVGMLGIEPGLLVGKVVAHMVGTKLRTDVQVLAVDSSRQSLIRMKNDLREGGRWSCFFENCNRFGSVYLVRLAALSPRP
jgi:hypothetical protein